MAVAMKDHPFRLISRADLALDQRRWPRGGFGCLSRDRAISNGSVLFGKSESPIVITAPCRRSPRKGIPHFPEFHPRLFGIALSLHRLRLPTSSDRICSHGAIRGKSRLSAADGPFGVISGVRLVLTVRFDVGANHRRIRSLLELS